MVQRMKLLAAVVVGVCLVSACAFVSEARAYTDVQQFSVKGSTAIAFFTNTDESGCVVTYVGVYASDEVTRVKPEPATATSSVFVFVDKLDYCDWVYLASIFGYQEIAVDDFAVEKKLSDANLGALISAYDYVSGMPTQLEVLLNWSATGPVSQIGSRSFYRTPGFSVKSNFKGAFAPATASGSVILDGVNLVPNASDYAEIADISFGDMVKIKY